MVTRTDSNNILSENLLFLYSTKNVLFVFHLCPHWREFATLPVLAINCLLGALTLTCSIQNKNMTGFGQQEDGSVWLATQALRISPSIRPSFLLSLPALRSFLASSTERGSDVQEVRISPSALIVPSQMTPEIS